MKSKLPQTTDSIFSVMSGLARDHGALNLSQGFPDFNPPSELQNLVSEAMKLGFNQYTPMPGSLALREQIALKTQKCYGYLPDVNTEITVTAGATQALFTAIQCLVHRDDEVIIIDPAYDAYDPAVQLAGGKAVHVPMIYKAGSFCFDWDAISAAINLKTKAIILNHPGNPSATILKAEDITILKNILNQHPIFLISDEVYEHMVFDGKPFLSLLRDEFLRSRSFVISSFGKTYHTTGWKLGYTIAPEIMMKEFKKIHQYNVFSVSSPMQWAYAKWLEIDNSYHALPDFYQQKRDYFNSFLAQSRFKFINSPSSYFQLADYSEMSLDDDITFTKNLVTKHGISLIPISPFFERPSLLKLVRICFAKSDAYLNQAGEVLCKI